jgi:hypothetical protein
MRDAKASLYDTTVTFLNLNRWRQAVAVALVVLLVGVSLGPLVHAGVGHDADCSPVIVVHDAVQHRIGATPVDQEGLPDGEHCLICHLFRSSRSSQTVDALVHRDTPTGVIARPDDTCAAASSNSTPLPARAPPARL